jgi:hypothetical protein
MLVRAGMVGRIAGSRLRRLGPRLEANGDFSDGATGWSVTGADATHVITFSGGKARYQSDTTSPVLSLNQANVLVVGRRYRITVTVVDWISGQIKTDAIGTFVLSAGNGTLSAEGVAVTTTLGILRNSANVDLAIDSVSVRQVFR